MRRSIWFDLDYLSTSRASPNDTGIVIIIIVIGEVEVAIFEHCVAIIAQSFLFFAPRFVPADAYFCVKIKIWDVRFDVEQGSSIQRVDAFNCQKIFFPGY